MISIKYQRNPSARESATQSTVLSGVLLAAFLVLTGMALGAAIDNDPNLFVLVGLLSACSIVWVWIFIQQLRDLCNAVESSAHSDGRRKGLNEASLRADREAEAIFQKYRSSV